MKKNWNPELEALTPYTLNPRPQILDLRTPQNLVDPPDGDRCVQAMVEVDANEDGKVSLDEFVPL